MFEGFVVIDGSDGSVVVVLSVARGDVAVSMAASPSLFTPRGDLLDPPGTGTVE